MVFMDYETTGIDTGCKTKDVPIQIGCVFTDKNLNIKEEYQTLIRWSKMNLWQSWPDVHKPAFGIHKISLENVKKYGQTPKKVCKDLRLLCKMFDRKPVIISDAPNFEMFWTKFIFEKDVMRPALFPFHYNAWSVNPLLQFNDISIQEKPHDALEDARILYKAVKKAWEIRKTHKGI
jgi:DNA polymerase III epsilon subunit-like protein